MKRAYFSISIKAICLIAVALALTAAIAACSESDPGRAGSPAAPAPAAPAVAPEQVSSQAAQPEDPAPAAKAVPAAEAMPAPTAAPVMEKATSPERTVEMEGPMMVTNTAGKDVEAPQYGGSFIGGWPTDVARCCDEAHTSWSGLYAVENTNEELLSGNWAKGSQGTGDAAFLIRGTLFLELSAGELAESWEFVDENTATFTIRQGVKFHDKAPTNGVPFAYGV